MKTARLVLLLLLTSLPVRAATYIYSQNGYGTNTTLTGTNKLSGSNVLSGATIISGPVTNLGNVQFLAGILDQGGTIAMGAPQDTHLVQINGGGLSIYDANSSDVFRFISGVAYGNGAGITNLSGGQVTNVVNLTVTNVTIYDSLTIQTNLTVNQNITVKGQATFNQITVTNQLAFTTNAFPLTAGTTWDLTKPYQLIQTNASFVVGALGGLTNNAVNWGVLTISNSSASAITVDLTALKVHLIGSNSTNSISVSAGKEAVASIMSWGQGVLTNLATATE